MKCWNSTFNAQGSRLIIVVVQLGALKKYYVTASGGAQEKGKTGWNSVSSPPKLMVLWVSTPVE
jgi:hypothetical protein